MTILKDLAKVREILENLTDEEWDDLHEHDQEDLQSKYGLDPAATALLFQYVSYQFDPNMFDLHRSNWSNKEAQALAECITESLHQSLDGWEDWEKAVIETYLRDIGLAVGTILKDK